MLSTKYSKSTTLHTKKPILKTKIKKNLYFQPILVILIFNISVVIYS